MNNCTQGFTYWYTQTRRLIFCNTDLEPQFQKILHATDPYKTLVVHRWICTYVNIWIFYISTEEIYV